MGSIGETVHPTQHVVAKLRFGIPDNSGPITQRAMYAVPPNEKFDLQVPLNDVRDHPAPYVVGAAEGLDSQGFTYVKHQSALAKDSLWSDRDAIEQTYLREVEDLVKKYTGATKVFCHNVGLRRKLTTKAQEDQDPKFYVKAGTGIDLLSKHLPRDKCLVVGTGAADASIEPARLLHVDYTRQGLADAVRYARKDIAAAAAAALSAEDAGLPNDQVPRYAAYGVWRPCCTVKRDPLAVCDWRTVDAKRDLAWGQNRVTSEVNASGEYNGELYVAKPPAKDSATGEYKQKWYWMSEQTNEDVLILKFADSDESKQARHALHGSPTLPNTENEPPRESIEVRVLALWD